MQTGSQELAVGRGVPRTRNSACKILRKFFKKSIFVLFLAWKISKGLKFYQFEVQTHLGQVLVFDVTIYAPSPLMFIQLGFFLKIIYVNRF